MFILKKICHFRKSWVNLVVIFFYFLVLMISNKASLNGTYDRYFISWLEQMQASIICSTYQTNRLLLLGINEKTKIGNIRALFRSALQQRKLSRYGYIRRKR